MNQLDAFKSLLGSDPTLDPALAKTIEIVTSHEPPRWRVRIHSNFAIREYLIHSLSPGEALDDCYDKLMHDESLIEATVTENQTWSDWCARRSKAISASEQNGRLSAAESELARRMSSDELADFEARR